MFVGKWENWKVASPMKPTNLGKNSYHTHTHTHLLTWSINNMHHHQWLIISYINWELSTKQSNNRSARLLQQTEEKKTISNKLCSTRMGFLFTTLGNPIDIFQLLNFFHWRCTRAIDDMYQWSIIIIVVCAMCRRNIVCNTYIIWYSC